MKEDGKMSQKSIEAKFRDLLNEKENVEKLKELLPHWREAYKLTMELAEKSFVQLAFFFLFFALIDKAAVTKASLFGIEFNSLSIPYAILFVLCIITFYRLISLACFAQIAEEAVRQVYFHLYVKYSTTGLCDLTVYPSLPQIENTFGNLEDEVGGFFAQLASWSAIIEGLAIIIILLIALSWAPYAVIRGDLISNTWTISIVSISWLLIFRALLLGIQTLRYYMNEPTVSCS